MSRIQPEPSAAVTGRLLIGASSWSGHDAFYPPGTQSSERLAFYARHFPIVEVNTSYYHVPRRSVVEGWVERSPPELLFDVKPPRELTSTPSEPGGEAPTPIPRSDSPNRSNLSWRRTNSVR